MDLLGSADVASFPVLNALILLPAVGALVVALLPKNRPEIVRPIGALFALGAGAMSVFVMIKFQISDSGFQFESYQSWIPSLGISWHVGVDGIITMACSSDWTNNSDCPIGGGSSS